MKNTVKRTVSVLLSLIIALGVAVMVPASASAASAEDYVSVMRSQSYSYTDLYGEDRQYTFKIPQINLKGEDADAVNAEIRNKFYPMFDTAEQYARERWSGDFYESIDYDCYLNGSVLSVLITDYRRGSSAGNLYYAYNFKITNKAKGEGRLLTNREMAGYINNDLDRVTEIINEVMYQKFGRFENFGLSPELIRRLYEKTVAEGSIDNISFYIDDQGKLNIIYAEFSPAGAEKYYAIAQVGYVPNFVDKGDINGDGEVNLLDRIRLTRALAQWDGYEMPSLDAADLNNDGSVNILDRIILTRHLAGWQGYEQLPVLK